jgi:DNA-binding NtrC family response regulator
MSIAILVVEDQAALRHSIQGELAKIGYLVHATASVEEAIAILSRAPRPCLVLWDALSPGTSSLIQMAHGSRVPLAVIPVSAQWDNPREPHHLCKRLLCTDALMAIVRNHCPLPNAA